MDVMKLSIIIPCYNYGKYLQECIGSIFANKTDLEYDITIVDDCSTDNTQKIYEDTLSGISEIKYIRNDKNYKLSKSRNIGIQNTDSDLIICLDADDCIPKNYIQSNYDTLIKNKVDISYNNIHYYLNSHDLF
jgi:glycosyltransferase involved in cell wall biosynthesis